MAEHMIETRILLRYDTLNNWMNSTVILKPGEAAVAAAQFNYTIESSNDRPEHTPPAIGIKIGDGYHYFSELPWIQGVAGDVYAWAKQQNKPSYTANEIQGLATFVQQYISGGGQSGDVTVEARAYRLTEINNKYYLQSRGVEDDDWVTDELHFIDLTQLANLLTWLGTSVDDYWNITGFTNQKIADKLNTLNYTDTEDITKVVTAVDQVNGKISVTKRPLSANNLSGKVSVPQGGTGRDTLDYDAVLVGNGSGPVRLVPIADTIATNMDLVPNYLVKSYVDNAVAGLAGAMHFIGEATVFIGFNSNVDPHIDGYNFSKVKNGDVILFEHKEYVWADGYWRLLGDEGSYAVKGSIMDADIADEAAIQQSKIANLQETLAGKVSVIEGKQLSSNDYTDEEKQKLLNIEENAQRNIIEHIYVNGTEAVPTIIDGNPNSLSLRVSALTPEEEEKISGLEAGAQVNKIEHIFLNSNELNITTVKGLNKSVNILLNEYTDAEQLKLASIEAGAQVNTIEKIFFNETQFQPNNEKEVHVIIDEAALNLQVIKGARVPNGGLYEDVDITQDKKLELARIAKTGNIGDIIQTVNTYVILDCGSSTTVL